MNPYVISALEQQWRKDPQSRVFFRLAEEYRRQGIYDKAIEVCKDGIKRHPTYLPARVCLGRSYQAIGSSNQAESEFREVLKVSPDNPHALTGLASICFDNGRFDEALPYYELVLIQDPNDETIQKRIEECRGLTTTAHVEEVDEEGIEAILSEDELPNNAFSVEEDEAPALFTTTDLEDLSTPPQSTSGAELDQLDLEFEKAIQNADETEPVFEEELVSAPKPVAAASPALDEAQLTLGLKHEKMEHYEAALLIYQRLQALRPGDSSLRQHIDRVESLLATEHGNRKKIRLLSNWIDKIKGVYYVS